MATRVNRIRASIRATIDVEAEACERLSAPARGRSQQGETNIPPKPTSLPVSACNYLALTTNMSKE